MNYKFDFVKHRKIYYTVSISIMLIGLFSMIFMGLNLGIDFKSGSRLEINIGQTFAEQDIRDLLHQTEVKAEEQGIKNVDLVPTVIRVAGDQNELAVASFDRTIDANVLPIVKDVFSEKYGSQVDINESKVDPTIGRELATKAIYSVLWASLGIILYVTIRFEYRFAIAAIIALLHDAFFVITVFSILRLEVDLPFIAAVLTVIGYSVNDTIVIFDRIRENIKNAKLKKKEDLAAIVNGSLNQTLTRSINTVLTVLITALALYIFGGAGIKNFSLALVLGLFSGTYSSIFIASQVWLDWKGRAITKKPINPQPEV